MTTQWAVVQGPTTYHDSPSGEPIEVGYVWTIARNRTERLLRIEVEPGATHYHLIIAAVFRNQLAEDEPAGRLVILRSGDLRCGGPERHRTD